MIECPYIRHTGGYSAKLDKYIDGADMCSLVDKPCLLPDSCETWEEIQKEDSQ